MPVVPSLMRGNLSLCRYDGAQLRRYVIPCPNNGGRPSATTPALGRFDLPLVGPFGRTVAAPGSHYPRLTESSGTAYSSRSSGLWPGCLADNRGRCCCEHGIAELNVSQGTSRRDLPDLDNYARESRRARICGRMNQRNYDTGWSGNRREESRTRWQPEWEGTWIKNTLKNGHGRNY